MDKFCGNRNMCVCDAFVTFVKYIKKLCWHKQIVKAIKIMYRMTWETKEQEMMHKLKGNCLSTFALLVCFLRALLRCFESIQQFQSIHQVNPSHRLEFDFEEVKNALISCYFLSLTTFEVEWKEKAGRGRLLTHFLACKMFYSSIFPFEQCRDQ